MATLHSTVTKLRNEVPFEQPSRTITVDDATIECSADLLSLLAVCTFTSHRMANEDDEAADLAADLTRCLRWAESLARQTHDDIVMLQRIARKD